LKRFCVHHRLIAAILVVFVLGVQFVNALSNSHSQVTHRHADAGAQAANAHADHGHGHLAVKAKMARAHAHSHQHDPSDHTHDLPLRMVLAAVQFTFVPIWHAEAALPFRSAVVHPLERPPKLIVPESLA
jgi:ABC-type nickel/cobalt efflux system permease component RcnA